MPFVFLILFPSIIDGIMVDVNSFWFYVFLLLLFALRILFLNRGLRGFFSESWFTRIFVSESRITRITRILFLNRGLHG